MGEKEGIGMARRGRVGDEEGFLVLVMPLLLAKWRELAVVGVGGWEDRMGLIPLHRQYYIVENNKPEEGLTPYE
jgi:hypothetical protein